MSVHITITGEDGASAAEELERFVSRITRTENAKRTVSLAYYEAVKAGSETPSGDIHADTERFAVKTAEALKSAGAAATTTETPAEPVKATRSRKAKEEPKPQISTSPENRVGPEDDPETEAQDAADEAAEVEANRNPDAPLTVDDVRNVMGEYVAAFGMPATQEDGPLIFAATLGQPPAGEVAWKLSLLPGLSQEKLKAAHDVWKAAVDSGTRYQKRG